MIATLAAGAPIVLAHTEGPSPDETFAALRTEWAHNLHEKRMDAWGAEFAADAEFINPGGDRVRGTAALRKLFETVTTTFDSDLTFDSARVDVSGDLAYDSGTYHETLIIRANGKAQHATGSYLTVYRRRGDGAWLIVQQMWTGTVQ